MLPPAMGYNAVRPILMHAIGNHTVITATPAFKAHGVPLQLFVYEVSGTGDGLRRIDDLVDFADLPAQAALLHESFVRMVGDLLFVSYTDANRDGGLIRVYRYRGRAFQYLSEIRGAPGEFIGHAFSVSGDGRILLTGVEAAAHFDVDRMIDPDGKLSSERCVYKRLRLYRFADDTMVAPVAEDVNTSLTRFYHSQISADGRVIATAHDPTLVWTDACDEPRYQNLGLWQLPHKGGCWLLNDIGHYSVLTLGADGSAPPQVASLADVPTMSLAQDPSLARLYLRVNFDGHYWMLSHDRVVLNLDRQLYNFVRSGDTFVTSPLASSIGDSSIYRMAATTTAETAYLVKYGGELHLLPVDEASDVVTRSEHLADFPDLTTPPVVVPMGPMGMTLLGFRVLEDPARLCCGTTRQKSAYRGGQLVRASVPVEYDVTLTHAQLVRFWHETCEEKQSMVLRGTTASTCDDDSCEGAAGRLARRMFAASTQCGCCAHADVTVNVRGP